MLNQRQKVDNTTKNKEANASLATIISFGDEWSKFDQSKLSEKELISGFEAYFRIFPWNSLPDRAEGFDMGCGSGRWAKLVASRVAKLNCIDPSPQALSVARRMLADCANIQFFAATANTVSLAKASQDFGYALGVLHHIPDMEAALRACVELLKPGAPLLIYIYYDFENRTIIFKALWLLSELLRACVCRLPAKIKLFVTDAVALTVYCPLAKIANTGERFGFDMSWLPLYFYRNKSIYTMRTDCRDRFGTPLERRYSRKAIEIIMKRAGLGDVFFSDKEPYWCAVGRKI